MKIIVGLGNPGVRYQNTRHNAGFMVLDALADKWGLSFNQEKFQAMIATTHIKGEKVILLKPTTFMNNSGFAVRECLDFYKVGPEDIIVAYDDIALPVGAIRLREKGSDGGQKGMKSIIHCIFTDKFARVRVGIGRDPQIKIVDWVLSKFKEEEKEDLQNAINHAASAIDYLMNNSFVETMNQYNKKGG